MGQTKQMWDEELNNLPDPETSFEDDEYQFSKWIDEQWELHLMEMSE